MYRKPLPDIRPTNAPYWKGARQGQLLLQQCRDCGRKWHPATDYCPSCLSPEHDWVPAIGTGTIVGRIFMHQVYWPAFADDVPYGVIWVELDEGVYMTSSVVDAAPEDIQVGARVGVVFDYSAPEITIPRFRLL